MCISCSRTMMVVQTDSNIPSLKSQKPFYENDTISISYNFWEENGMVSFVISNKLNIPLYIDWKKSNFFAGNTSLSYWRDEENIKGISVGNSYKYPQSSVYRGNTSSSSVNSATVSKPERITFLAPHSNYTFYKFSLTSFMPNDNFPFSDSVIDKKTIKVKHFGVSNTPLKMRNFITLSTHEKFDSEFYLDNQFWIKDIFEMDEKLFNGKDVGDSRTIKYTYPFSLPNSFFYVVLPDNGFEKK